MTTSNDQTWQVLSHLSGLCWIVGIPGVVGPLVLWLVFRDRPPVEPHAREALNFHLSILVYGIGLMAVGAALILTIIGIVMLPFVILAVLALLIIDLVFTIIGGVQASKGVLYRYPLNLRLIAG